MRITRYTDYSLRVLMYLALKEEELSTIAEIASSYDISKNHLMKVVQELNNKGYLIATRGKNGGLRLKGNAEDINVGALVRDTEQDLELVECFGNNNHCVITPVCQLKHVLAEALEAFFTTLDQYTLADLLPGKKAAVMVKLLRIGQ
ncbi:Rrf2 family transcriptional regulator [Marinimicrobium sp. ABcell2]|uniref:RrF2 family transcriptional regulator n=1 Tax=Marinimicrobium sp. ABcell2 TaxID=3069751 RepID=UPI0027AF2B0D|nr:Rrf2 family transcriptional regulator [Marinimicrobium sp. ABcell2]MDQ2076411.1 Rrf2 family transcriptional regulator [Marinimicrobium sp. ABcell2]